MPRTYVVSNYLTAADVALYGALHPIFVRSIALILVEFFLNYGLQTKLSPAQYFSNPSLTRYFDLIQSESPVRTAVEASGDFPLVSINLQDAPGIERVAEAPKKKEKAPAPAAAAESKPAKTAAALAEVPAAAEGKAGKKKEKKEKTPKEGAAADGGKKKGGQAGGKGAVAAADDGEPVPSMIDLRVGHIVDSELILHSAGARKLTILRSHEAPRC